MRHHWTSWFSNAVYVYRWNCFQRRVGLDPVESDFQRRCGLHREGRPRQKGWLQPVHEQASDRCHGRRRELGEIPEAECVVRCLD